MIVMLLCLLIFCLDQIDKLLDTLTGLSLLAVEADSSCIAKSLTLPFGNPLDYCLVMLIACNHDSTLIIRPCGDCNVCYIGWEQVSHAVNAVTAHL